MSKDESLNETIPNGEVVQTLPGTHLLNNI